MKNTFLKPKSINQASKLSFLFVALFTIVILGLIIYNEHQANQEEIKNVEQTYIKQQREIIKKETNRALKFIAYKHNKYDGNKPLKLLQAEIVDAIEQMRNERDGTGYVFIYTFDGVNIADPILKQNSGKNLLGVQDPNGKLVIKDLIEVSKSKEGGYVEYMWNKPIINQITPKISYAASYAPWEWMVGTGVYMDDVYDAISEKKREFKKRISNFIFSIVMLGVVIFFISMAIYQYFTDTVKKDIAYIESSMQHISHDYQPLDLQKMRYVEYRSTAEHINEMVEEIKHKKLALEDLNKNLEQRVEEKTEKLQRSKEYAESLVEAQDKFMKNAIHEINTPLSIIITNIDLFNMNNPKNRYLTKIEAAVKIIHNIYNDLSYAVKKDRIVYKKQLLDFSKILNERVEFFNEVALGSLVTLKTEIEPEIYKSFNETELQRVFDNNISNAIKYSFNEKEVTIRLFETDEGVIFEITNEGDTILHPDQLFERFYREHDSRGGFGIGLHIVKEICDKSNVNIAVTSNEHLTTFKYIFS